MLGFLGFFSRLPNNFPMFLRSIVCVCPHSKYGKNGGTNSHSLCYFRRVSFSALQKVNLFKKCGKLRSFRIKMWHTVVAVLFGNSNQFYRTQSEVKCKTWNRQNKICLIWAYLMFESIYVMFRIVYIWCLFPKLYLCLLKN